MVGTGLIEWNQMGAWKDALQCRNRAAMLKDLADKAKDQSLRIAVLNVARHYEAKAASLELELRAQAAPAA